MQSSSITVAGRLAAFAAVLALLFGAGAAAGGLLDPDAPGGEAEARGPGTAAHGDAEAGAEEGHTQAPDPVRGLASAEGGLRLVVDDRDLRRGASERLRFRIVDARGRAVRDFDVEHTKRMHLIVARRDLTGFQHLHPTMDARGTWSTRVRLRDAGAYRLFADFSRGGEAATLATDLRVDGAADLAPLPAPRATAVSDGGYDVRLDSGAPRAGAPAELRFTVTQDGRPVETEPYLGAGGHLVALRDGDLAYLHVHPVEDASGATAFEVTFPTTAGYRLFLQFKVGGEVQTVAFTEAVR